MYKQQQLRYSNQPINAVNSNNLSSPVPGSSGLSNAQFQQNYSRMNQTSQSPNRSATSELNFPSNKRVNSNIGSMSPNNVSVVGLQNSNSCPSPPASLSSMMQAANQKKQCKISYLFCNQTNHEMNQLNMACLKQECLQKGLICCMCLDDHYDHLKHCMAFQKIVTQLKGKIDKNSTYYDESLLSQTSESKDVLSAVDSDFKDIQDTIEQFQNQVNQYLEMLKIQYQKQYSDSVLRIKSFCSNAGASLKEFFEKIEINSIIGQSLHTNPSIDLKSDINSFLQNVEMGEDLKSIKLKIDSALAMNKQSEEIASQVKRDAKALSKQFQKYMSLLKNQDFRFSQSGSASGGSVGSSARESQISSGSNSQRFNSGRKKRKYEKLAEKHQNRFIRSANSTIHNNNNMQIISGAVQGGNKATIPIVYMKPISIMDSSETNSQKHNLDNAVLLSTPSSEHLTSNNNYCLSFQDKKAFLNGPLSSSRGSERKMNDFNLSDYMAHSSQSGTQSKKSSVQKQYQVIPSGAAVNSSGSLIHHRANQYHQHTFGKPQVEISMECEDEEFNSSHQQSQRQIYLNQQRRMKLNKRYSIEDEESSKQPSQSLASNKVASHSRNQDEEFEDEDEPYEEDMIGRSDYTRSFEDEEEDDEEGEEENYGADQEFQEDQQCNQDFEENQEEEDYDEEMQENHEREKYQNSHQKHQRKALQSNQSNGSLRKSQQQQALSASGTMNDSNKIEYSSSKKTQTTGEVMSFQMPIRNDQSQSQDRLEFELQIDKNTNQKGNGIFNSIEKPSRLKNNSPRLNQNSHLNAESPTFQRETIDPSVSTSKIQNQTYLDNSNITNSLSYCGGNGNVNSNGSSNQSITEHELLHNKSSASPRSKQASTKATSSNNLSPSKSRSHSPNVHVLDNSPTRPVTRSSAKKAASKDNLINSEQSMREEQSRRVGGESADSSNLEQQQQQQLLLQQQHFYNDSMMQQEQSVQILDIQQQSSTQRTSQSKEFQSMSNTNGLKSPTAAMSSLNFNSNSGSKNKTRKMKRSSGSRIHDNLDLLKIEHSSQQSLNHASGQKQ